MSYLWTFTRTQTRGDVLYWVQYYYRHPEADLLKLAVESLLKERMKPEGTFFCPWPGGPPELSQH